MDNVRIVANPIGDVIDYLTQLLTQKFSNKISQMYFGDVGVYPLKAFQDGYGNQRSIFVFDPVAYRLVEGTRTQASEVRDVQVDILTMVNMAPYFNKFPAEAPAERDMVQITFELADFLARADNAKLGGRVINSEIGDIDFAWTQRQQLSIRASRTPFKFKIRVQR